MINKREVISFGKAFVVIAFAVIMPGSTAFANDVNIKNKIDGRHYADCVSKTNIVSDENAWPMFRHDPAHTGYTTSSAPDTSNLLWIYSTSTEVLSSPAYVEGKIYCASYDGTVFCLNESDGSLFWNYTTGDQIPYSSPAVKSERVFIGSKDTNIYCLNAIDGSLIWNYTTGGWIYSCPTLYEGKVYVGSSDNCVYCLDAETGAFIWKFITGQMVWCSPAVVDGKVYIGSMDCKMYCLDADNGLEIWNYSTGMIIYSSPTVLDGKVYFGSFDHFVYCLDAADGSLIWKFDAGVGPLGAIFSSPAIFDGKVYIGIDLVPNGAMYCLDASDGTVIWNCSLGGAVYNSPAVADGKVYIGTCQDSMVMCFDAFDGTEIWTYQANDFVSSSPAIVNGKMYVGSNDGNLYCFGPSLEIQDVTGGFLKIHAKVKNNELEDISGIKWTIILEGGLIPFGRISSGTIDIPAGGVVTIDSKAILGIGKPIVNVQAGNAQKKADALVLLFYHIIK
jgi:outer membrane protein assembly factor BamB